MYLTVFTLPKLTTFPWIEHSKQTILKYLWLFFFFTTLKEAKQSVSHPTLQNYLRAGNKVLSWEWGITWALTVVETLVYIESRFPCQVLALVRTSSSSSSLVTEKHIAWQVVDITTLSKDCSVVKMGLQGFAEHEKTGSNEHFCIPFLMIFFLPV